MGRKSKNKRPMSLTTSTKETRPEKQKIKNMMQLEEKENFSTDEESHISYESFTNMDVDQSNDNDSEYDVLEDLEGNEEDDQNADQKMDVNDTVKLQLEKQHAKVFKKTKVSDKLPSHEELNHLRKTEDLFKNNLIRLEIEELLKNVHIDSNQLTERQQDKIKNFLFSVKDIILNLEDEEIEVPVAQQDRSSSSQSEDYRLSSGIQLNYHPQNRKYFEPVLSSRNGGTKNNIEKSSEMEDKIEKVIAFSFLAPASVNVVGSYLLNTMTLPNFNIDLAVTMPSELFNRKDILNYRYFNKRTLYLHHLGDQLISKLKYQENGRSMNEQKSSYSSYENMTISWGYFNQDPRKPILLLKPNFKDTNEVFRNLVIRVLPAISDSTFEVAKLRPIRNNVRRYISRSEVTRRDNNKAEKRVLEVPTPHYNNAILEDMSFKKHLTLLYSSFVGNNASVNSPGIHEALILLKVWLAQRDLDTASDGLSGYMLSIVFLHLLSTGKVNPKTDSIHAIMVFFQFLVDTDFKVTPTTKAGHTGTRGHSTYVFDKSRKKYSPFLTIPVLSEDSVNVDIYDSNDISHYHHLFEMTLLDPSTGLNIFGRISKSAKEELLHHANISLKYLQNNIRESFNTLFLQKHAFHSSYDLYVCLPCVDIPSSQSWTNNEDDGRCNNDLYTFLSSQVDEILRKGTVKTGRVKRLRVMPKMGNNRDAPLSKYNKRSMEGSHLYSVNMEYNNNFVSGGNTILSIDSSNVVIWCGLVINPEEVNRIVDRGPNADDTVAASQFRAFWGDKSELRRFKDGAIVEATVWADNDDNNDSISFTRKKMIIEKVIEHLLAHHQPQRYCDNASISIFGYEFISLLSTSTTWSGTGADLNTKTREALKVFDNLSSILRSLHEETPKRSITELLPLRIASVEPMTPYLRYTSAFPITKHPFAIGNSNHLVSGNMDNQGGNSSTFLSPSIASQVMGKKVSLALQPLDVVIRTESSSTWPIEQEALMKAKTAFLLFLKRLLPNDWTCICEHSHLDVLVEGYAVRLHLFVQQDEVIYKNLNLDKSLTIDAKGSQDLMLSSMNERQKKNFKLLLSSFPSLYFTPSPFIPPTRYTMHHKLIHSLQLHYPTFGSAVRIVLAWVSNHRFYNHLCQELIELLVASLYLKPYSNPPHTPLAALISFLRLLVDHDWKRVPLYINFKRDLSKKVDQGNDTLRAGKILLDESEKKEEDDTVSNNYMRKRSDAEIEEEDMNGIRLSFEKFRANNTAHNAMFVVASYDKSVSTVYSNISNNSMTENISMLTSWCPTWSGHKPEPMVLLHIINTAKGSLKVLENYLKNEKNCTSNTEGIALQAYNAILPPKNYYSNTVFDGVLELNKDFSFSGANGNGETKDEEEWIDGTSIFEKLREGHIAFQSETLFKNTPKPIHKMNVSEKCSSTLGVVIGFQPVNELVCMLEKEMSEFLIFYFTPYMPTKIYFTVRPPTLLPSKFVLMNTPLQLPFMFSNDSEVEKTNKKDGKMLKKRKNTDEDSDSESDSDSSGVHERSKGNEDTTKQPLLLPNIFEIVNRIKQLGGGLIHEVSLY